MTGDTPAGPDRGRAAVRMRDVARHLGMSVSTVSRALSQPQMVSADTITRVNDAIARLGYRVNLPARDLRTRSTKVVLVVVPRLSPLYLEIHRGAEQVAEERGYTALMAYSGGDAEREHRFLDEVLRRRADGVVLVTSVDPARLAQRPGVLPPIVLALEGVEDVVAPVVAVDIRAALAQAVDHLTSLGHRRIAYLGGAASDPSSDRNGANFRAVIAAAGLDQTACPVADGGSTVMSGTAATAVLLSRDRRPTAIVAADDMLAVGALHAARQAGLAIGPDLSVVGFGDLRLGGLYDPPLTTVAVPKVAIGRASISRLLALLAGEGAEETAIETTLLVRGTTARIASGLQ